MDFDWKESLQQIVNLHEDATECQIIKSMTSFQSLGIQLNRENICCFFDILQIGEVFVRLSIQCVINENLKIYDLIFALYIFNGILKLFYGFWGND